MRKPTAVLTLTLLAAACRGRSHPPILSPIERDQVRPAAEWLKDENVRLLRDYVRIDTTSPVPGEREGALFLQRFFDCAGIETEIVCPAPGRCNLLARIPGKRREGALLLLNHIDVVGAFPELWNQAPPFSGQITVGYLYGRGSYDMKSLGLLEAIAMRRLKERGITPETDILFLAEADEEYQQRWGSRWLLENRPDSYRGVSAVVNEGGTNEAILRDLRVWGLETLQAGYGSLEFETDRPEAFQQLKARFPRLSGEPVAPHPQVVESFGMLANHLPFPFTNWLRDLEGVRRDPKILAKLADRYGAFMEPRIHWDGPYAYPPGQTAKYRGYVIVAVPPGVVPDPYLDPIAEAALGASLQVVDRESSGATTASPYPTSFTEMLKQVSYAFLPGIPFGPVPTVGGWTTSVYFRRKGIPAYGYSPILMNITDSARRHANDERVFLRDYVNGIEIMDQVVLEYAFFPPG